MAKKKKQTARGNLLFRESGTEGSRHDPTRWDELKLRLANGRTFQLHIGLIEWARVDSGPRIIDMAEADSALRAFCGLSIVQLTRVERKLRELPFRQHKSHGGWEESDGFPGETLTFCKCGAVLAYRFNRSAIE